MDRGVTARRRARVYGLLKARGYLMSAREIADELDEQYDRVFSDLRALWIEGKVQRFGSSPAVWQEVGDGTAST